MRSWTIVCATAFVLAAGVALAADTSLKIRKLGNVEVSWNPVTYREELMAQLRPGLTWRLGKGDATRLKLEKMALVTPGAGVLLPGEQTLNLRFWAWDNWVLVAFEENNWEWSADFRQLGLFDATVGNSADAKEHTKALDLKLNRTTRGNPTTIAKAAVTGADAGLDDLFTVPDDVEYDPQLRERFEALPWVELIVRFGPHKGVVGFEPVPIRELKGRLARKDGETRKVTLIGLDLPEAGVRSQYLEEHEGELPVAVLTEAGKGGEHVVLHLSGGEVPMLWSRMRNGDDVGDPLEGTRAKAILKKSPKSIICALDGSQFSVTVAPWVYTFDLSQR